MTSTKFPVSRESLQASCMTASEFLSMSAGIGDASVLLRLLRLPVDLAALRDGVKDMPKCSVHQ